MSTTSQTTCRPVTLAQSSRRWAQWSWTAAGRKLDYDVVDVNLLGAGCRALLMGVSDGPDQPAHRGPGKDFPFIGLAEVVAKVRAATPFSRE